MGAAFLAGHTGIEQVTMSNNAAYLASWIKALKGECPVSDSGWRRGAEGRRLHPEPAG